MKAKKDELAALNSVLQIVQVSNQYQVVIGQDVNTAKRKGCYAAAHCHADDAIRNCTQRGVMCGLRPGDSSK